jgi:hypothetical protein
MVGEYIQQAMAICQALQLIIIGQQVYIGRVIQTSWNRNTLKDFVSKELQR